MADSDNEWRRWGETDPYFGVLTDPRFRRDSIAQNRSEFFASGRLAIEERLTAAERYFGPFERRRALDFGCGVGRLSIALAAHFDEVVGIDIAPAMLAEARANADSMGVSNLRLALSDDCVSQAQGSFDLVMSAIVLQHIPTTRGLKIIDALLSRVAPGGVAALQLCIGKKAGVASRLRFWFQCNIPGVHELVNIKRGRPPAEPFMQMNAYPLDTVIALADAAGFGLVKIDAFTVGRFCSAELLMRRR